MGQFNINEILPNWQRVPVRVGGHSHLNPWERESSGRQRPALHGELLQMELEDAEKININHSYFYLVRRIRWSVFEGSDGLT